MPVDPPGIPPPPPDPKGVSFEDKTYKKAYKKYLWSVIQWAIKRLIELA
jgi:hypothetical protein